MGGGLCVYDVIVIIVLMMMLRVIRLLRVMVEWMICFLVFVMFCGFVLLFDLSLNRFMMRKMIVVMIVRFYRLVKSFC